VKKPMGESEMGEDDDSRFCLLAGHIDISMHDAYLHSFPIHCLVAYVNALGYNPCMFGSAVVTTLMSKVNGEGVV
jgi:hypothetical protein